MFELICYAVIALVLCQAMYFLFSHPTSAPRGPRRLWGVAVTPDLGHGTAITFQSGILAKLLDVSWSGIERASVETTVLDTSGGKTFLPGDNYDPGELSVEMQLDTDAAWGTALSAAPETITITWPDAETWACSGFLTGLEVGNVTNETVMTVTATLKATGSITF